MKCESAKEFPWAKSHPWDVDIAIVGGGPAGLSAAIRLRWLKTMPPLPLSTCLINSGPLGGLAKLGNSTLTGPGFAFPAGDLINRLQRDLDRWPLPILNTKVVAVDYLDNHFKLTLESGEQISALAVIMACGMLDIRNMAEFWRQGVVATFGNRQYIYSILKKELPDCDNPLVLGGPHLLKLQGTIRANNPQTSILVPPATIMPDDNKENLLAGELLMLERESGKLTKAVVKTQDGIVEQAVDKIIVEFNSLELQRGPLPVGTPALNNGFIEQDKNCQTVQPGLFAAGDCAGPPFSALVALGQGAEAAFGAYRFVHQIKYGKKPALFAYFGDEDVNDALMNKEDFPLDHDMKPVRLLDSCPQDGLKEIWSVINGTRTLADLAQETGQPIETVFEQIKLLIQERAVTFAPFQ